MELSGEQAAAVSFAGGAYVAAGPGTGKTHVLVARLGALLEQGVAPERLLVVTFSRRSAADVRQRIARVFGGLAARVEVRTFHGFASRILAENGMRFRTRRLLDPLSAEVLLDAAIAQTSFATLGEQATRSRGFRLQAKALIDDIERASLSARQRIQAEGSARLRDLLALHARFAVLRERCGASDINDLVARAVAVLDDPATSVAAWIRGRYAHVLVDEFQDADRVQLDLLAATAATIFAVGDEAQAIYRFRSAAEDIVAIGIARFGLQRFTLGVSRRCPPAVCALAAQTPFFGANAPAASKAEGHEVDVAVLRSMRDEAAFLAEGVEHALEAGVPPREIAVILRSQRPLAALVTDALRARAIPVAQAVGGMLADPRIAALRAALDVLAAPDDLVAWRRLYASPVFGFDPFAVRFTDDVRTLDPAFTARALAPREAWETGDLALSARRLVRGLELVAAVVRDEPPHGVRRAAARLRTMCAALASVQRTLSMLRLPATPAAVLALFDEHVAALDDEMASDTPGAGDDATMGVRVLSVHGAKGLEFARVFVADAIDGRFPQAERRSTLLSETDRALLVSSGIDGAAIGEAQAAEEASLWYVAVTRCSDRLTISYAGEGLDGVAQRPSRFLPPAMVPQAFTAVETVPLAVRAAMANDASLRARLLSGDANTRAVSPVFGAFAAEGRTAFAPAQARPLPVPERLSVSDAETWLQCERRLYYRRFLRLGTSESSALEIGTAVHAVLERFHAANTDFRSVRDDAVLDWTSTLHTLRRTLWSDDRFERAAVAAAAAAQADRLLAAYSIWLHAYARAKPFVVSAREQSIAVPVGPLAFAGRIDRIDRDAKDRAHLIDYKTGRAKKTAFAPLLKKALENGAFAGACDREFQAQLALYATAVDDVASFAYVSLKGTKDDGRSVAADESSYDALRGGIATIVEALREHFAEPLVRGELLTLPPTDDEKKCTFCDFARICSGPVNA